jgi:hypothetical protein
MDNINESETNQPIKLEPIDRFGVKRNLPNASAVLVLGICSIPTCLCYGFPGFICALVALILSRNDFKAYKTNPDAYTTSSYNNLNAGRICAIIGLSFSSLVVLYVLFWIIVAGTIAFTSAPWNLMNK